MASKLIDDCCQENGVAVEALRGGSRLHPVAKVRRELVDRLTTELGIALAETARLVGVSTSGVAKILVKVGDRKSN
jgi:putative transposase